MDDAGVWAVADDSADVRAVTDEGGTIYVVAPVDTTRGLCAGCGCRLQAPYNGGPPDGGSIWLTPWHDCGGRCTVCMTHAEDPDAIAALRHWLALTASTFEPPYSVKIATGTSNVDASASEDEDGAVS